MASCFAADSATNQIIAPSAIVAETLAHSYRLKAVGIDDRIADARMAQAKAQGLPRLSADGRALFYTGVEATTLGPGVTIPAFEKRYGVGVEATQPAYTGGRIRSLKEGARWQKEASQHEKRGAEADLTLDALGAYWNWAKACFTAKALEAAVTRMEAHAKDMRHLYDAGLSTENDKLSTDVQLDRTRLQLEEAHRRIQVALARLTFLTGNILPPEAAPQEPAGGPFAEAAAEGDLLQGAMTHRPERALRQSESQVAKAQVKTAQADFYPQFAFTARYEAANPNFVVIPPRDKWMDDGYAGIVMSWNIFDWGLTKGRVAEAAARAEQARLRQEQTDDQISLEVREARINLQDARQRLQVAERVETSARRNLKSAQDLWQNGLTRHSEYLDAHNQLTDAQREVVVARSDVELAQASLDHATGKLVPETAAGPKYKLQPQ